MNIAISVVNRVATPPSNAVIVCGNSDYNLTFDFDAEWSTEASKVARFVWFNRNKVYSEEIPFEGNTVAVPILNNTNAVQVGVYAGNLRTTTPAKIVCEPSILCYGQDAEKNPDSLAQIKGQIAELVDSLKDVSADPEEIRRVVAEYLSRNPVVAEEADPTVPAWAKAKTKPTYTATEVGAVSKSELTAAINTALAQAKASGEFNGEDGADGSPGEDGNGIRRVLLNSDYTLTFTFDDGTTYTTGSVRGPAGKDGSDATVDLTGYATELRVQEIVDESVSTMIVTYDATTRMASHVASEIKANYEDGRNVVLNVNGELLPIHCLLDTSVIFRNIVVAVGAIACYLYEVNDSGHVSESDQTFVNNGVDETTVVQIVNHYLEENQISGGSTATIGSVELLAANWVGSGNLYSQVVSIAGVTENSQVDLTPSVEQLVIFYEKDLTFVTENDGGVVTVYAIGQKPENDYTIQVTITEVSA